MKRKPKPKLHDRINTALRAGSLNYVAVCKIVRLDYLLHTARFKHDAEGIARYIAGIEAVLEGTDTQPVKPTT